VNKLRAVWCAAAIVSTIVAPVAADPGRDMFYSGRGLAARIGPDDTPASGSLVACRNCHGVDGLGDREGVTNFPPINWQSLTRPTGSRPAYDATGVLRAVSEGFGSDGRRLDTIMPRYSLDSVQFGDLQSYLATINAEQRRGVSSTEVVIGVPAPPRLAAARREIAGAIQASLDQASRGGAIHGRRIRIVEVEPGSAAARGVFAVVGMISDADADSQAFRAGGTPNLFPMSALVGDEDPDLERGAGASTKDALVRLISEAQAHGAKALVVCRPPTPNDLHISTMAVGLAGRAGIAVEEHMLASCPTSPAAAVLMLSSAPEALDAQIKTGVPATIYGLLDQFAPLTRSPLLRGKTLHLANTRTSLLDSAVAHRTTLLARHGELAGRLLTEALVTAGHDLTRARLVKAIDGIILRDDGFGPLDYATNRLTGSKDVSILTLTP